MIISNYSSEIEKFNHYTKLVNGFSIKKCLDEPVLGALKLNDIQKTFVISHIISSFCACYNVSKNMNDFQIMNYANIVLKTRFTLSIPDLALAFENAKQGRYKDNGKSIIFDRIDFDVLNTIIEMYEAERADVLAQKHKELNYTKENDLLIDDVVLDVLKEVAPTLPTKKKYGSIYKNKAISANEMIKAVKNKSNVYDWHEHKLNAFYLHFERIGMINIPIEKKKEMFAAKINKGISNEQAVVQCRKDCLKELFDKLLLEDVNVENTINMYFENFKKNL